MKKNAFGQFMARTLTRDLSIGLILIVTLILLGIGGLNYIFSVTQLERDLTYQSHEMADKLASILSLPVWALDTNTVAQIADAYQNAENVAAIRVMDPQGHLLYDRSSQTEYRSISARTDIFYKGELIGLVEVSISTGSIADVSRNILATTLATVFLVVVVVLVATSFLLRKFLDRPLADLTRGIDAIARGNYSHKLGHAPQAEIDGIVRRVNAMAEQIAEREAALRQSEERFRQVVTSISDHVYVTELTAHGEWINHYKSPNLEKLVNYPTARFLEDWHFWLNRVIFPDDLENAQAQIVRLTRGEDSETEYRLVRSDGELVWIRDSARVEQAGASKLIYGVISDITDRKRAEAEIRQLNAELEQRVQQRTAELQTVNKELEAFSYSVSHDLRAPLRAIAGYTRILEEEYLENLPPEGVKLLDTVRANAGQMELLIDGLLKLAKLGQQVLRMQTIQPDLLVRQALELLKDELNGRQVEVEIGDLPTCDGDPTLMLQVWINLLSNAFKYTRTREVARVEIGCQIDASGEKKYFVKDNGVGFNMRHADKLFGVFQRLHSESEFEGTGVGLTLVQRIIQRHGGHIWADSELGVGATFYFSLP